MVIFHTLKLWECTLSFVAFPGLLIYLWELELLLMTLNSSLPWSESQHADTPHYKYPTMPPRWNAHQLHSFNSYADQLCAAYNSRPPTPPSAPPGYGAWVTTMQDMTTEPPPMMNTTLVTTTPAMAEANQTQSMADEWLGWSHITMTCMFGNGLPVAPQPP